MHKDGSLVVPLKQLGSSFLCPLCGKRLDTMYRVKAYIGNFQLSIGECSACQLAIQAPMPSVQGQRDYINWRFSSTDPLDSYITDFVGKKIICRNRLKWLNNFNKPNNRLLDIGAGNGTFCSSAIDFGYDVCGTELSAKAISQAKRFYGLNLFFGDIHQLPYYPSYGLVTLWDVIEHLPDPLGMLQEAFARITPNGLIVINTGNYNSISRLERKSSWPQYLFDHLFYFSPKSIEILVRRAGFSNFQIHRLPQLEFASSIKHRARRVFLNPTNAIRQLRKIIITKFRERKRIQRGSEFWDLNELLVTARKT